MLWNCHSYIYESKYIIEVLWISVKMDNSNERIVSSENDDTESTDSSLCIIMAEELDEGTNENVKNKTQSDTCKEHQEIIKDDEENQMTSIQNSEDSFSAMTQSQYAQVRDSCNLYINILIIDVVNIIWNGVE